MMRFASTWWEIELTLGWTAESKEECVTITKSSEGGALQLSAYRKKDGAITREDLLDVSECDDEMQCHLQEKTWGEFAGFQLVCSEDDTFWRKWWLANGQTLLFVTYNCELANKDSEKQEISEMVGTLKARKGHA
jgi:hypothetical protein